MNRLLLLCLTVVCSQIIHAQLLSWTPAFPKETDPITITVDATKGNQGLLGYNGNVYVHIGAITSLSTGPSNWLHAPFTWGSTEAAALATPDGTNKWKFTISNPRTFFNLAAGEQLKYIAILFRQGGCTTCPAQRNTDGSDMYVPVYTTDLAVRIDQPAREPKYVPVPEPQNWVVGSNFTFTANANKPSTIKLFHNGVELASQAGVTTLSSPATIAAFGSQIFITSANDGTSTKYDTLSIFVSPSSSPTAALPAGVRDGINYESGDTSVTLVLRAPGKNIALVMGDFTNWNQNTNYIMNRTPDGQFFWIRIRSLTPGTEYGYQYIVDGNIKISDPYAQKILDPFNDQFISSATYPNLKPYPAGQSGMVSVLQTAEPGYTWSTTGFTKPDKRGLIIYELLLRDFIAAHDWKTLKDTLSYLKRLGVNAIEIMPFNEFEGNSSWGYNPFQYFALDKYYGNKNSLKAFIDSCHKNGIAVIMDIVLNHTYGPSPLAQLYWDNQNNRPAANNPWYNAVQPHAFGFGDDFNHESANTKYFFNRVMEHWITEYKIDGYRIDFSKGLTQRPSTNDAGFSAYDASRIAILNGYHNAAKAADPTTIFILEHFADNTEEKELSDNGMMLWGNQNYSFSQATMGFATGWDFSWGISAARGWTNPYLVTYMESHDEERNTYRNINFGNSGGGYNVRDSLTALKRTAQGAAFLLTIPGPKMIWEFGELGYDFPINYCVNGTINNNCRLDPKPIRWDYYNQDKRRAVFDVYSKMIGLRSHNWYRNAFLSGTTSWDLSGAIKWISLNSGDSSRLFVVGNFGISTLSGSVQLPVAGTWYDYMGNTTFSANGSAQVITLLPGEYHVYANRNINNLNTTPVSSIPNAQGFDARVFPNPVKSVYTVSLDLLQSGPVTIDLYNVMGQHISTVHNGFMVKGSHQLNLDRKNISKGSYYLDIRSRSENKTLQITIQ